MNQRVAFFVAVVLVASSSRGDGYGIDSGEAKLSVGNGRLIMCSLDLAFNPIKDLRMTWDLSLKQETPIAIRASTPPYGRWRIGYDPGGKDPTVFAAKADTPGIVNWKVGFLQGKGYTIQAAGGPLAGWYLTPGTENIEMDVRGKNTVVGTKPVLSKEPAYFEIDEIGP